LGKASTVSFGLDGMKKRSGNTHQDSMDYNPIIKNTKDFKTPLKYDVMKILPGEEVELLPS
jgi:hypothetical protein